MDAVIEALKQFLGEYVVASAILAIAIIFFVWWLSAKFHSMKIKVDGIDELPCKDHANALSQLSERIEENGKMMARIESRLESLPFDKQDESIRKLDERLNNSDAMMARIEGKMDSLEDRIQSKMDSLEGRIQSKMDSLEDRIQSKMDSLEDRIQSKLDALPCALHSERQDKHEERMNLTDALLHKMEGQLELLVSNSVVKNTEKILGCSGSSFSAKHSPRVLNENGISLLNDLGGNEFLEKNMDFFINKIETLQPKTAFDVENLALAVLQISTSDDMFIPIKNWIYNAPMRTINYPDGTSEKKEVTLDDAIFVLSLPIRDKYLELHPF